MCKVFEHVRCLFEFPDHLGYHESWVDKYHYKEQEEPNYIADYSAVSLEKLIINHINTIGKVRA